MRCENCGRTIAKEAITEDGPSGLLCFCSGRCAWEFEARRETLSESLADEL